MKEYIKSIKIYSLLLLPIISAFLALWYGEFILKSGSAGFGIIILFILFYRVLRSSKDVLLVVAAFFFSIIGDWFLSHRNGDSDRFIAGIVFFFLAHIGYLSFALLNGKVKWGFFMILLALYLFFFYWKLYPSIDNPVLMWSVLGYLIISCFSLAVAIGIRAKSMVKWPFVFGIFLILFSDTIIALREFMEYDNLNFFILPTYYLAHIVIVFSLMKRHRDESVLDS